jgi:hypothetical protein
MQIHHGRREEEEEEEGKDGGGQGLQRHLLQSHTNLCPLTLSKSACRL